MDEKSTNILVFTSAFKPLIGGSEIAIESIAKNLPDIFFDIITPRYDKKLPAIENEGNIRIYRVGLGNILDKFFFPITGYWLSRQLMKNKVYADFHAYQASYGGLALYLLKTFQPSIRSILTLQEGKDLDKQNWLVRFLRKKVIQKSDIVTAISIYLAEYAGRYTKNPAIIIPNGVNLSIFNPSLFNEEAKENLRKTIGITRDDIVIVTASRLVAKNGISHIIESADGVFSRISRVKYLIIGDGPLWQQLRDKATNTNNRDRIIFTGAIEHHILPLYLSISHLFIRPSETEGLGNAFLEAMAMGLPVLATPVGGIVDFIEDNRTGFLWYREKESLSQKIVGILENSNVLSSVAQSGKNLVKAKYNWLEIAEKFRRIYQEKYEPKL